MTRDERADDTPPPVTIAGRYRIVGTGVACGDVITYAGADAANQRRVALSVLRGAAAADAEFVTAVREQVSRLATPACHHRALVRVYDSGTTDEGAPFVALEPVAGRSLRAVLDERGPLGIHDGLRLAIEVGEGLETLHRSGIVHGELRPESLLLTTDENGRDVVKLVGVELTAARRTMAGLRSRDYTVVAYLAPEQVARAETTEAADVHALGLLTLELLTGHRPDGGVGRGLGELPPAIARIVAKALEEGPGRRYSRISLMVNDIWSAENDRRESSAHGSRLAMPALAWRRPSARRHAHTGMATALVVGLVLVGVTAWVLRSDRLSRSVTSETESAVAASPAAPTSAAAPPMSSAEAVRSQLAPARDKTPTPPQAKQATVPAVVPSSPPVTRQVEPPVRRDQPPADSGDGTAIIDWLLKGGRPAG